MDVAFSVLYYTRRIPMSGRSSQRAKSRKQQRDNKNRHVKENRIKNNSKVKEKERRRKTRKKINIVVAIVSIVVLSVLFILLNNTIELRVKFKTPKKGTMQMYFNDGSGWTEGNSDTDVLDDGVAKIHISDNKFQKLKNIRLDVPSDKKKYSNLRGISLTIAGIEVYDYTGKRLYQHYAGKHHIGSVELDGTNMKIEITDIDPYWVMGQSLIEDMQKDAHRAIVGINIMLAVICFIVVRTIVFFAMKYWEHLVTFARKAIIEEIKVRHIIIYVVSMIFLIGGYIIAWLGRYFWEKFDNVSFAEILFHLKVPMQGTGESAIKEGWEYVSIPVIIGGIVAILLVVTLCRIKTFRNNRITVTIFGCGAIALWIGTGAWLFDAFKIDEYINMYMQKSTFIEEEYTNPAQASLEFPEKKRNLVYIYLESMETTFMSLEDGGSMEENYIPELTELAKENVNFSEDELVGGAYVTEGAGWTIGAMVAQTSGIPLLLPIDGNSYDKYAEFLPGAVSIGDILAKEGYNQEIMVGSNLSFGGRKIYFDQHGKYENWDLATAKKNNKIPKDYNVWWGFEDEKLYDFAKEEIQRLAEQEEPFNFTMLTVDTHASGGYKCKNCENQHKERYENVFSCASRQVYEFISWLKEQDFYEDTTIVICGDHLTMDSSYINKRYNGIKPRRVYNCFINSANDGEYAKNRKFTTLDLYPTTLAAMGVEIEGNKLGLGTNLFSNEKTLAEQYGYNKVNKELKKQSIFYNKNILKE